ncbi:AAA ATPase [Mycolicibacterium canariasense]|uniref:AAA ATPase n=1 Tax=Mycolicibacterium canariasense TaxID=228230 RepID=A0A100WCH0_MYCCR|nr:AAA ATPase [Mycolicibacterium canariasense]
MACEVTFMGGPADGVIRVLEGDEPPAEYTVRTAPDLHAGTPPGEFTYVRQVSQKDSGPLWVYVPR